MSSDRVRAGWPPRPRGGPRRTASTGCAAPRPARDRMRASTCSGAPLTTSSRSVGVVDERRGGPARRGRTAAVATRCACRRSPVRAGAPQCARRARWRTPRRWSGSTSVASSPVAAWIPRALPSVSIASMSSMRPSVSVPVLSVIRMSMSPRSSMHTSRLTSTLSRASRREPDARLVLTTAGSSCGVMPTAMARREQHRFDHRPAQQQIGDDDEHGQRERHPQQQIREPAQTRPGSRFPAGARPDPAAMRPNWALAPVAYDHRGRVTRTDHGAHERAGRSRRRARRRPVCGSAVFSVAVDSPVRMLSLHSSPLTSISRTSAGTSSPSFEPDDVTRYKRVDVDLVESAVAAHGGVVADARNAARRWPVRRGTR